VVEWRAHEQWLLTRAKREGDRQALDELVRRMLPLARALARKYQRGREPLDDLVQVASVGLVKAIERFDLQRGAHFLSYAIPTMVGELKRHYRDVGWTVHVERTLQERALRVKRQFEKLEVELGRSPAPSELALRCQLSVEEVLEARLAVNAYSVFSLDAPAGETGDRPLSLVAEEDPRYLAVEDASMLQSALRALPVRERQILALRFGTELSQREIGDRLGISQMHVSRLLSRSLDRLRQVATSRDQPASERRKAA
jgi:RNA polymerase sigma-B factor